MDDFEVPAGRKPFPPLVRTYPDGSGAGRPGRSLCDGSSPGADQLTVYSPQTSYSVPLFDEKGQPYAGLVELLEPLGSIDAKPDGKKYKLRFTAPGGRQAEAQFNDGKDKGKVRGESYKLPANFVLQNGRGYIPLSTVPELLTKLLATPVQLHPSARRLFIGDMPIRFTLELDKGNPPKLMASFPESGESFYRNRAGTRALHLPPRTRDRSGQDSFNFNDQSLPAQSSPNTMGWPNST